MVDNVIKKGFPFEGEAPAIAGDEVEYIKTNPTSSVTLVTPSPWSKGEGFNGKSL